MEELTSLTGATANLMAQQSLLIADMTKKSLLKGMSTAELSKIRSLTKSQEALARVMKLQARALSIRDDTLNDIKSHPISTFSKFPRLPAETREAIWEMALPEPRFFVPYIDYRDDWNRVCLVEYFKPPTIRGVCKESWDVTEKHGGFEFATPNTKTCGIWFNYRKDVVLWLEMNLHGDLFFPNVQNIAIAWDNFSDEDECISTMQWALSEMHRCRKIIVMTRPQRRRDPEDYEHSTLQLFSIDDTEVISDVDGSLDFLPSLSDDEEITWADVKEGLETLYHKRKTLQQLGIDAEDLPILEFKELLISR